MGGTLNICQATSVVGGRVKVEGGSLTLKIAVEPSQIALSSSWCSKLRLTAGSKNQPLAAMGFVDLDLALPIRWHYHHQQQHVITK
ncbi:hypothetical protein TNCV_3023801 [Trichonephila clavipes]|nr:hypothetical protein TNCV_3023801 [Trichonephila clavipes]